MPARGVSQWRVMSVVSTKKGIATDTAESNKIAGLFIGSFALLLSCLTDQLCQSFQFFIIRV